MSVAIGVPAGSVAGGHPAGLTSVASTMSGFEYIAAPGRSGAPMLAFA